MIGLKFRDLLPQWLLDELDQLVAGIRGWGFTEHYADGKHSAVHADSVQAQWLRLEEQEKDPDKATGKATWRAIGGPNGYLDVSMRQDDEVEGADPGNVFRVVSEAKEVHVDLPSGRAMALGVRSAVTAAIEQRFEDALTAKEQFRLAGQSSYTPAPGDTAALGDIPEGPKYSVYRLTPTADTTIEGIYADLVEGNRGQVLFLINDSSFTVTFGTGVVTNKRKILGGSLPMDLGPQHIALLIYDTFNEGWRIMNVFTGTPGGGGSGEEVVFCARIELDDAEIRGLNTTKIEIPKVDLTGTAPGVGFVLNPFRVGWTLDTREGAYSNVSSPSHLRILIGDVVVAGADISNALSLAKTTTGFFDPAGNIGSVAIDDGVQSDSANLENLPFYVDLSNALGDVTVGDPDNTLLLDVWYVIDPTTAEPFVGSIVYTTDPRKVMPAAATRLSLTPNATSQADSAWVELTSSAPTDMAPIGIAFNPGSNPPYVRFDIGVGAAGSEVVIGSISGTVTVENTIVDHSLRWPVPIRGKIPAGSRVAIRMAKQGTSTSAWTVAIEYYDEPIAGNVISCPTAPQCLPTNPNTSAVITPSGTTWAYSAWALQASASPVSSDLLVAGIRITPMQQFLRHDYEIELGIGPVGQERVVARTRGIAQNGTTLGTGGVYFHPLYPMPIIRAGNAISFRMRKSDGDTTTYLAQIVAFPGVSLPLVTTQSVKKYTPSGANKLTLSAGANGWGNGAYTPMFTTVEETVLAEVCIEGGGEVEIDLAIGLPGFEVVVATTRAVQLSTGAGEIPPVLLPIGRTVPGGEVVSARCRKAIGSATQLAIGYYEGATDHYQRTATAQVVYPPAAAAVSVNGANSAWVNSAWGELEATTAADGYITGLNYNPGINDTDVEFELGVGAAGFEVGIGSFTTYVANSSTAGVPHIPIMPPIFVAQGSRLAVRFRKPGTSTTAWQFSALAVPAP